MINKIPMWLIVSVLFLFILGINLFSDVAQSEYVGSAACLECHDDIQNKIMITSHFRASLTINDKKIEYCEACHGAGSAHIEDPEVKGSIRNFKDIPYSETVAICLSCHQSNHTLRNFQREPHYQTGNSCLSCHSVHPDQPLPKLLARRAENLCFSCHQDKSTEFSLPYHHKVKEGRMRCWDCHQPHQIKTSVQAIGLKKIEESCYKCHPSQRGPFTYEHLASNVGTCTVCHLPHGSENARLLRRSSQFLLCLECHSGPSPEESLVGSKTPSFHITSKTTYQNCTICHVKIHGSYLDPHFLR